MCVLALSLGVALVVSMDLALQSSRKALEKINEIEWTGVSHKITGKGRPLQDLEAIAIMKKFPAVSFAPMVRAYVSSPKLDGEVFTLLGIDPFLEKDVRKNNAELIEESSNQLQMFLLQPGSVFTSKKNLSRFGILEGSLLDVKISGKSAKIVVHGFENRSSSESISQLDSIMLADIATVQEVSGRIGQIDALYTNLSETQFDEILRELGEHYAIADVKTVLSDSKEMTHAFEFSLVALSLLGLLVSSFLIFSALYFLVTERVPQLSVIRIMGLRSKDIFLMIVVEALCIGIIGAMIGIPLGYLIGKFSVLLVSRTLRDLYWSVHVSHVYTSMRTIWIGIGMSVFFSILGAVFPALYARSISHMQSSQQSWTLQNQSRFLRWSVFGVFSGCVGYFIAFYFGKSVGSGFLSGCMAVVAFTSVVPLLLWILFSISKFMKKSWSVFIGVRQGQASMLITWFGTASLAVALAMSLSIAQMTFSFRSALIDWMKEVVVGDVFVSPDDLYGGNNDQNFRLNPEVVKQIENSKYVKSISYLVIGSVATERGNIHIAAVEKENDVEEYQMWKWFVDKEKLASEFQKGGVLISEPLARRQNWLTPTSVRISTPSGEKTVPILGVFREYGNSQGVIHIQRRKYIEWWKDEKVSAVSVMFNDPKEVNLFTRELREKTSNLQLLKIQSNQDLFVESLRIFDQTFEVTRSLKWVSVIIAILGLFAAQGARGLRMAKDTEALRTLGVTSRNFQRMKWIEALIHAVVASFVAIILGCVLTWILIYVIQVRAFGWSFPMILSNKDIWMTCFFSFVGVIVATVGNLKNNFKAAENRE